MSVLVVHSQNSVNEWSGRFQLLSEQHKMEIDTLRGRVGELEVELQEVQKQKVQEVTCLRQELQSTNEKSENLKTLLSQSHMELGSRNSLVQQLRTYIGELVPDNRQAEEQKTEIAELKSTIQTLEKEREALQTSMSLLQTRLSSLTHILTLQENDLCKKTGTHIDGQKTQMLLKRWREKVFSLMVQLKSEEMNKESDEQKMQQRSSPDPPLLGFLFGAPGPSLRLSAPTASSLLWGHLSRAAVSANEEGESRTAESLVQHRWIEMGLRHPSYEDLKNEVQLLNEERDHLSTELKRSALILEEKVMETREKLEAEIAECHDTVSLLRQSLHETEEREKVLTMQVMELERKLHEACETAEQLKEQLQDQNGEYEKVVALRQTERQMQRERNRSQETMRTLEDATRVREEQLSRQLRDAERDKNLMIATLRQEGLFATYQKNRTVAIQSLDTHTEKGQGPTGAPGAIGATGTKESLSNMLANLQSLGAALLKEDVDHEDEDEELM
ncbi:hypothetical protein AB205_0131160 [Aquarana catesbeiana]|uniref:Coiled-coil alpha-helical rod protein 1 n=1 Tax=Aquarana catesbeiana TaxID=8400 RepID=A0A2G9NYP8_AQUCT|nr:hypothetical protein AB205_0131160 [Aquarana catesbeiana]